MRIPIAALTLAWLLPGCAAVKPSPKIMLPPPAPTLGCPHIPKPQAGGKPPKPPASDFPQVLQPGAWAWGGLDYVWTAPRWVILLGNKKPKWVDGTWRLDNGACVWVAAHWASPPVRINY